jgi:hypothetical protein
MRRTNVTILILLLITSCGQKELLNSDKKTENNIKTAVTSGQQTLELKTITDFTWDSLLILIPYSNYDKIEKDLNINLSKIKHTNIESRDDINQLIFFKNNEPVDMVEYPRYPGDFSNNKVEFIQRDNAIFDIIVTTQKNIGGDLFIELRKR